MGQDVELSDFECGVLVGRGQREPEPPVTRIEWKAPAHWSAPADSSGGQPYSGVVAGSSAPWPPSPSPALDLSTADVTGCGDCPCFDAEYGDCRAVDSVVKAASNAPPPPECPLRAAPLLVRLRVGP